MDNRVIDVVSESMDDLRAALSIMWNSAAGSKCTHYAHKKYITTTSYYGEPTDQYYDSLVVDNEKGCDTLVLYWTKEKESIPFAYPMDLDATFAFVQGWLKHNKLTDESWDSDILHEPGFRVFTETWGHIERSSYTICAIQPSWALYGK